MYRYLERDKVGWCSGRKLIMSPVQGIPKTASTPPLFLCTSVIMMGAVCSFIAPSAAFLLPVGGMCGAKVCDSRVVWVVWHVGWGHGADHGGRVAGGRLCLEHFKTCRNSWCSLLRHCYYCTTTTALLELLELLEVAEVGPHAEIILKCVDKCSIGGLYSCKMAG